MCAGLVFTVARCAHPLHPNTTRAKPNPLKTSTPISVPFPRNNNRKASTCRLSAPELDKYQGEQSGQNGPNNHDQFDSHFAHRRNISLDIGISTEESASIAKDIQRSRYVNKEEDC